MAMGTLICFNCCWTEQPQPKRRRPRIDRSMIGQPTDFRHTAHIGSGDMSNGSSTLNSVQGQMQTKGGYEYVTPVSIHLNTIDLPVRNQL